MKGMLNKMKFHIQYKGRKGGKQFNLSTLMSSDEFSFLFLFFLTMKEGARGKTESKHRSEVYTCPRKRLMSFSVKFEKKERRDKSSLL